MVPVGKLAPQCLKLDPVGRCTAREAPGPEDELAIAVDVEIDASSVIGGGVV